MCESTERQAISQMVDRTRRVEVDCPNGRHGWGSGVLLGPAHHVLGHAVLATANHVAHDGCSITVRGQPAVVLSRDEKADIALLLIPAYSPWYLEQSRPWLGMPVVTVGWPVQLKDDEGHLQVSRGHVEVDFGDRLKVSSPAFFGNSGGPVFDEDGKLVGLLVSMSVSFGYPIDGQYFATPASRVFEMYEALR